MNAIPGAMTTLETRPNTALLIIDVQVGVVDKAHDREAIVGNIAALVERARHSGAPVIWIQHVSEHLAKDSDAWRIVPELVPTSAELIVEKAYGDAFEETRLETILNDLEVGRLIIAGAQTDACIRSTLHGALVRGYDVTLAADAHTTDDLSAYGAPPPDQVIAHTNLYWKYQTAPGRTAASVASAKIEF